MGAAFEGVSPDEYRLRKRKAWSEPKPQVSGLW
jgi:hypothetical protein